MMNANVSEVSQVQVRGRGRPAGAGAKLYTFKGKKQTLREWANELGFTYHTLYQRLNVLGLEPRAAFHRPRYARKGRA